jgi:hypothetical protein
MTHAAVNAAHYVRYAIWRKTMSYEPPLEDDTALGKDGDCEYCGNFVIECTCNSEPDRMYGSED